MAKPKNEHEKVLIRFRPGTAERIDAVREDQDRASFVRAAVDGEIARREKAKRKP